jgi:hypothetical protein
VQPVKTDVPLVTCMLGEGLCARLARAVAPHSTIVARFSHLLQECHRWQATRVLEFS